MGFAGIYTAIYDYKPQAEGELEISEGDLLFILDKASDDGWWKAKKKAVDVDDEEPVGLVPNNYVEEARPTRTARALYDYTRQTDEEVSFSEDAELQVFDTSDPDWTLVQVNSEYGFAPSNYIELVEETEPAAAAPPAPPVLPQRVDHRETESEGIPTPHSPASPVESPAAALAGILNKQQESLSSSQAREAPAPSAEHSLSPPTALTPQASDEDDNGPRPALPQRPVSHPSPPQEPISPPEEDSYPIRREVPAPRPEYGALKEETSPGIRPSPPYSRINTREREKPHSPSAVSASGYHIYNISEMISIMGKRKKMPTTLGINIATGTIFISPENSEDGPHQEWTAERLTHYSIEGKHVFLDLVRPSKSVDFHAGAKDTAQEIVSALGEIAGGYKAEGLREVIAAGTTGGKKKGQVLYDFMAQGDDEVTVAIGDEVIILDDTKSEEWWMVRRMKNGQEGVVPSSYIEITGVATPAESSFSGVNAGLSAVEQNRREEERLARESARKSRRHDPGSGERHKRDSRSSKQKPNPSRTRKWTDRTGTFTVVAEFIGLTDGKIHLHKQNGVKIAVPVAKMSIEDLEYVERVTGESLDEDKPLSDIRRRSQIPLEKPKTVGASIKKEPDYDWFDFFLKAGVGPHLCERYAQNFSKDSMDESVLPDITSDTLRTLGLKEGDILRVMRYLDGKYNRKSKARNVSFGGEEVIGNGEESGGLFSGPGGALRNNTRKGRPAPPVQTSDVVDPKAFELKDSSNPSPVGKEAALSAQGKDEPKGFEDSAWEVKHPKATAEATASPPAMATQAQSQPSLTGAMADLSLLQEPLQPSKVSLAPQTSQPAVSQPPPQSMPQQTPQQQPQMTGANPAFFAQLAPGISQASQVPGLNAQMTGFGQPHQQQQASQFQTQQPPMPPRQRPQPPPAVSQGSLLPPPPPRPLSAPNNPSALGPVPLQPQLTGLPQTSPHLAPPGHSLSELNQQRFQQSQLQPQATGVAPLGYGMGQFGNQLAPQPTGLMGQQQGTFMNGPQHPGFQSLVPQQTGYSGFSQLPAQQPLPAGSINSVLPPPLQPQQTGANGFGGTGNFTAPPPPPIPELPAAPLQPQKTGPAPPVRFGVHKDTKKLTPQPTGLKANLAQATPSNPFGF
ncbi:SH3 domain containing protein [Coccidioides posadasii C735 delta SOWgp]|uniref:Actin cytoskeleton-regulatory complex protein SLA1 n=1 Tax=Coccidioides posadasii (strain C735) TaxID=222929 RepID=C5P2R0_COCP7|nr:SH3 domain containing protein [Coccidioides posadasii C735 delta SOWgp]EER28598.1 SH3 domain containing protein [Coccidioides posadasii C735 delta SOWgp]|eukprot:XP_003070743.1 SH3 domain containing protein [Coccidioides posadasii C735 delta SOWgp]